jgi:hypothetical protein
MALTDLSRVTQTLTTLLAQAVARDTNVATIEFSAAPPDDTSGTMPTVVSVYLFHAIEDPHGKNWTPSGVTAGVPVQQTPLALCLYYLVTANSTSNDEGASTRALIEQRLTGFVARAFHDFPVIDDDTVIPAVPPALPNPPLLETSGLRGDGNTIQIILRPVPIEETVNFWSAEQERLPRFSLFYEVRVILFDTPRPEGSAPPVLSVAEFVSVSDRTTILRSRSLVGFALPAGHPAADPTAPFRFVEASPARPALFPPGAVPAGVPPRNNRLTFEGAGFQGDRVSLSVEAQAAEGAAPPETRRFRLAISRPVNPDWEIEADGVRVSVGIRTSVTDETGTVLTLYPGLYRARVIVGTQIADESPPRFIEWSSADSAFAVVPQITAITDQGGPPAARLFRITLFGAYLRDELDVTLTVAGRTLAQDADLAVAGNFDFTAATPDRIDFAVDTTVFGSPLPVQLIVNDAEAAPAWAVF